MLEKGSFLRGVSSKVVTIVRTNIIGPGRVSQSRVETKVRASLDSSWNQGTAEGRCHSHEDLFSVPRSITFGFSVKL